MASSSNRDSSSSPSENVERSSDDQVTIERRTPRKLRSPRKVDEWQLVGSRRTRSNRSPPNSPAEAPRSPDLSSHVHFPALQMSSSSSSSGDRDPFKQDVAKALR